MGEAAGFSTGNLIFLWFPGEFYYKEANSNVYP